jgi:hypothetical protein
MKKNLLAVCILVLMISSLISCQPDPGPQPTTPTSPSTPTTPPPATLSDTVTSLIGTWHWDSAVNYTAGVKDIVVISYSAGGVIGNADQSINFTMTKYNGQGDGSAIGANYCEAFHTFGGSLNTLAQWSVQRQYPLNKLIAFGYFAGNIHLLTSNRLVTTNWSGAGD